MRDPVRVTITGEPGHGLLGDLLCSLALHLLLAGRADYLGGSARPDGTATGVIVRTLRSAGQAVRDTASLKCRVLGCRFRVRLSHKALSEIALPTQGSGCQSG